jgi:hypothetical protein
MVPGMNPALSVGLDSAAFLVVVRINHGDVGEVDYQASSKY